MKKYLKEEIDFEEKIAHKYNEWYHNSAVSDAHDSDYIDYCKKEIKPGDKVLDLGCGPAPLWKGLSKIKKIELTGSDISPAMIKEAKKLYPKGKFIVANSEELPFKDETFDVVICSSILHHLPNPKKSLAEVQRVLKPYGILIGREPQQDQFILETSPILAATVMCFVHLIRHRQKTTPAMEPAIHGYHQAYNIRKFVKEVENLFVLKDIKSKYPFSGMFADVKNMRLAKWLFKFDRTLANRKGHHIFYKAVKYGYDRKDIIVGVYEYLDQLDKETKKPAIKFSKMLVAFSFIIDRILPKK